MVFGNFNLQIYFIFVDGIEFEDWHCQSNSDIKMRTLFMYVVVQFYYWLKFDYRLFLVMAMHDNELKTK